MKLPPLGSAFGRSRQGKSSRRRVGRLVVGPGPGGEPLQGIFSGHGIEILHSVGSRSEKSMDVVAWSVPFFPCCASGAVLGRKLGSGVSPCNCFSLGDAIKMKSSRFTETAWPSLAVRMPNLCFEGLRDLLQLRDSLSAWLGACPEKGERPVRVRHSPEPRGTTIGVCAPVSTGVSRITSGCPISLCRRLLPSRGLSVKAATS